MTHTAPLEPASAQPPSARAVMEQASGENFPVAMRVLSRVHRRRLLAVYGFARLADELGDELAGDRLAALDWLEGELDRAYAGGARHPLLVRLQQTLAECALPRKAFVRLIDANRLDQRSRLYETWEQLQAYCSLSANPVGELVLGVFELASPGRIELSDRVCTALQLVEHIQDVGEDVRRDRYYLPAQDLARFDCSHEQLAQLCSQSGQDLDLKGVPAASPTHSGDFSRQSDRLRKAVAFEVSRARTLLAAGLPLVASVHGRPKLALAGFVAGGETALVAIERADFDVLGAVPRPTARRRVRRVASVLARSRGSVTTEATSSSPALR
jgi:squalene synthase HpnC